MQTTDRTQTTQTLPIPAIAQYFATMNAQDYAQTAALFASEGILHPPFESDIIGPEAIAQYLKAEATGMQLQPRQIEEQGDRTYQVTGKVKTSLFTVNVAWFFILNPDRQIASVTVKLIASPQELLKLRSRA
ncbi:nuclear transport factor 2 family protein [Desertifilum sp. FACHB-1129]|uniref:Nuclear transport factor 2 domain-containing protein n=1 Tax=Desertifilum tharense IPPAS B-1220 TaxID=1781255 RepID=A0A1E5QQW4_9CYAN|nr:MULTISPECIES: nuclear transport factor 2 family protein [Desertifilum]MDA0212180.1 nuclear transport factor 2 family protein [Cyanobacteria bacterium FC1]MBD2313235.1 nuclear transport factor 2 family protein [Desertifilum sp. FACHB-1129]MBD2323502.1 nuclear transport factor 2 family protein [Desertifilum sp. FACHB-866]MBD2334137.1 nuclear transport factor 2 family protein [Desertifilum sp. FACHB-868]OEJ76723.1 hypothetical protein BH720_02885 [Desertifilum tharense IPPAS B-1220]